MYEAAPSAAAGGKGFANDFLRTENGDGYGAHWDNSGDIAEIVTMANISPSDNTEHIQDMARATIKMVTDSIDAFVKKDIEIANAVITYDDVVDGLFDEVKTDLIEKFGNPESNGEKVLDLLMIAKYFERMGDHAVEIAKWVLFSITGRKER